ANFTGTVYLLDYNAYPHTQEANILAFRKDIAPSFKHTTTVLPHHYLFRGKSYIYFAEGEIEEEVLRGLVK
ncbi:MAG: hypothetical protein LPJ89_10080, partial [Hymenobacteraceae bacterium]|nr:hypothetical protein [Hymenobacteraceae bacterium]MDX5397551.1 hypothetical protein [Hymenobacteraceae bacterium]MDX5444116.1 hypothetical protein [Hymenobacteraceae bacterium]MDX5513629.1 hypothetical protein [Hymenobacteraceae bacterium]